MVFVLVLVNVLVNVHVDYLVGGRPKTQCDLQTLERIIQIVWIRAIMDNMEHNTHDQGTRLRWFKVVVLVIPPAFRSMVTSHLAQPDVTFCQKYRM